jgi:hypothetical protein
MPPLIRFMVRDKKKSKPSWAKLWVPQIFFRYFSSSFTQISAHTNVHDPRTTPSGRKVIRRRKKRKIERKKERERKKQQI